MKRSGTEIGKHIACIICITALIVLCTAYPFLSGEYDSLAVPLSNIAQVFGVLGISFAVTGLLWLIMPKYKFALAVSTVVVGTFVSLVLALFATLSVGISFGVITITVLIYILFKFIQKLKGPKNGDNNHFNPTPLYLICIPVLTFIFQMLFAPALTRQSRSRAILNANEFITHIEEYRTQHGRYPLSLQAQNKDYFPNIVGIEKYFYAPQGKGYNLSFEQPRFFLDRFGTREWIVYNPRNEHRVYSHTAWLLPSEEIEPAQGWYASGNTEYLHWKYFLFD